MNVKSKEDPSETNTRTRIVVSPAGLRILLWCSRTGASVYWTGMGSAWSDDEYQWPVQTSTFEMLVKRGLLEKQPQQRNHGVLYRVPAKIASVFAPGAPPAAGDALIQVSQSEGASVPFKEIQ